MRRRARASGVCQKDERPVSKLKGVNHAGDRTEADKDNYREHKAEDEGGKLAIGFHRGFRLAEPVRVYAKLMPYSTKFWLHQVLVPPSSGEPVRSARKHLSG